MRRRVFRRGGGEPRTSCVCRLEFDGQIFSVERSEDPIGLSLLTRLPFPQTSHRTLPARSAHLQFTTHRDMDDHAVLSAVEGVDEKVAVGLPLGKPNQAVSRRVSGRSNRPARRNATTAAMFQVLSGIVCGAIIGLLIRRYLNNRSAGHDAGESVSPQSVSGFAFSESEKIQIQVAPPESAPALNARLAALTESNADLKQQVIHAAKTSAKLWNLIDALRVENEQTKSLVRRETCDVEKLAPICAALNDEPQTNIPTRVRQRTSDLRLRRLWGTPADDPSPKHPRELLVVTVGEKMMANVNKVVLRFDPVDSRLGFGFGVE